MSTWNKIAQFKALPKVIRGRIVEKFTTKRARLNLRDPKLIAEVNDSSLLYYWGNIHSQRGQDGILAEIFRRLNIRNGLFIEFGAWDGIYLSNSRWLYEQGWRGVWIEGNKKKFDRLSEFYGNKTVNILGKVGAPSFGLDGQTVSELLTDHAVNGEDVTFLSIDVDGPDLDIFEDCGIRPPVVLIEGGANFNPEIKTRLPSQISWKFQQPLQVIRDVAKATGYEVVCWCQDAYLVRTDLAGDFTKFSTLSLYRDGFFFMNEEWRESIRQTRNLPEIVNIETQILGVELDRNLFMRPSTTEG